MELTIRVKTADDDYTVHTTLFNIVQLERKYKTTASALQTGVSVEQLGYLAYEASRAAGKNPPAQLDDFLRSLVDLSVVEDDEAMPGPTDEGQLAALSPK